MFAGCLATAIAGAMTAVAATNVSVTAPGTEQSVKQARAFEDYTLANMKRVFFDTNRSDMNAPDTAALGRMLKQLRANDQSVIELRGYSDGAESAEQGSALSAVRAQTVAWYFVQRGISSNRVRVMAFQEIEDASSASNPERRRVDVRVFVPPASDTQPQAVTAKLSK
jgi:outer membrane protein OmpA-like peptidoglycan-associated protein